jgi:hypothetical protein
VYAPSCARYFPNKALAGKAMDMTLGMRKLQFLTIHTPPYAQSLSCVNPNPETCDIRPKRKAPLEINLAALLQNTC